MAREAVERETPARSATCSSVGAGGRAGSTWTGMLSTTVGLPSCGCRSSDDELVTGRAGCWGSTPPDRLPGAGSGTTAAYPVPTRTVWGSARDGALHDAGHELTARDEEQDDQRDGRDRDTRHDQGHVLEVRRLEQLDGHRE